MRQNKKFTFGIAALLLLCFASLGGAVACGGNPESTLPSSSVIEGDDLAGEEKGDGATDPFDPSDPSDPSDSLNDEEAKKVVFEKLEKVSDPVKTVYYLDEGITELDLTGLSAMRYYQNAQPSALTLTADMIETECAAYDLTTVGCKELWFYYTEDEVFCELCVRVYVKERTVEDVETYTTITNAYVANTEGTGTYKIADFVADTATDAKGNALTVTNDGVATYVPIAELAMGETLVRLTVGQETKFCQVIVAKYIRTVADFSAINNDLNAYYLQVADLDFNGTNIQIGATPLKYITANEAKEGEKTGLTIDLNQASAKAFNGTYNGNGYVIENYQVDYSNLAYNDIKGYGVGIFHYIGEHGTVCNVTLRNAQIKGRGNVGLVAGVNYGTIQNICVLKSCDLFSCYGSGAVICGISYGMVKNVVSFITQGGYNYGTKLFTLYLVSSLERYTQESGVFGYIGDTSDLTVILGKGWVYVPNYGTVYGNANNIDEEEEA